jgi:CBS domain-containing protein
VDVATFLARFPPFDALAPQALAAVAGRAQIEHFAPGVPILERGTEPARFLYVVRKGAVEIESRMARGRALDLLGEGEIFGARSVLAGTPSEFTFRAHEDTLCYLLSPDDAALVLGTDAGLRFLVGNRARRPGTTQPGGRMTEEAGSLRPVGSLIRRPAVTGEPSMPVASAAERMARERVSSLLIPGPRGLGILTDRDLRTRVVAERRSPETPVEEVMTFPVVMVDAEVMAGEVLLRMLESGFHHFPVRDRSGSLVGVVTDTDLMGLGRHTPFALKSALERARNHGQVVEAARDLPEVVAAMVDASADPVDVGHVVAFAIDATTRRLLELAIARLGEPPVPWAWLALGSAARQEQALHTDQDHAFAYDPGAASSADLDEHLARIAASVTDGLAASGIPRCHGDAMASHPMMRRSLEGWCGAFRSWISEPGTRGSILLSIAFDFRTVAGPLEVEAPLDDLLRTIPEHPLFLRHLAKRALDHRPPTGFFRDLVVEARGDHAGQLDVKHGGIAIVTNLARAYALGRGRTEKRTLQRLHAAEEEGAIDAETRTGLEEAFRFLWQVRLEHQVRQLRERQAPDYFIAPAELGTVARHGLKEAFRVIARAQRTVAASLGASVR